MYVLGIGYINRTRVMRTVRSDGVILKPSEPMVPIDSQFVPPSLGGTPEYSFILSFLIYLLLLCIYLSFLKFVFIKYIVLFDCC